MNVLKKLPAYFFVTGFIGHVLFIAVFIFVMHSEQLGARLLIKKALDSFDINPPDFVHVLLKPEVKYDLMPMDGIVKSSHPRMVLPEISDWDGQDIAPVIKRKITENAEHKSYAKTYCQSNDLLFSVACWLTTNDSVVLNRIIRQLGAYELNQTAEREYSNGWILALAYDLVFNALSLDEQKHIENKITQALKESLSNLDEDAASLWHGRITHASIAWICAVVLSDQNHEIEALRRRAQNHFLNAIDALAYTEIWPNGYNYWIQNRAFLLALGSAAYLNGLESAENSEKIKQLLRRLGYWTIYATRPDHKIEGYGDEGARVDLKDETRRFIDLVASLTKEPVIAGYSNFLGKLHGDSYYRGYRWGYLLFNDPSVLPVGNGSLASVGSFLSQTALFGKKTTNYAYFRSGWGKDDTFVSFKAGHTFSHHGHYDAGHFTVFKGKPLAINSSTYDGFFAPHRLNYAIRTIAKNSLLIQRPFERVRPNRFFKENISDGGQRLTMPTSSAITSLGHWFSNYQQGQHYEGAELLNFAAEENKYHYISVDITPAYNSTFYHNENNGGKVSSVIRQLLYLPDEDHLFVYDQVSSTDSIYQKKWLLHSVNQPQMSNLNVLKGSHENGILESHSKTALIKNDQSYLNIETFLPEKSVFHLVGGKDFQYYVETDGDDRILDGQNFNEGSSDAPWHDVGFWRLELQPEEKSAETQFLVALTPTLTYPAKNSIIKMDTDNRAIPALGTQKTAIIFLPKYGLKKLSVNFSKKYERLIIVGLLLDKKVLIKSQGARDINLSSKDGIACYTPSEGFVGQLLFEFL